MSFNDSRSGGSKPSKRTRENELSLANEPQTKKRLRRSNEENEFDGDLTNTQLSIQNLVNSTQRSVDGLGDLTLDNMEGIHAAGQVMGIELENFMCHKNLRVEFKEYNCIYIVGPNGSGKSAIFAGLNIGLGGKGRNNDRGNNLSSYIKEGETFAKIRVSLKNIGDNRHPDYDEKIVVERTIRQGGTSTYALKSYKAHAHHGNVVSTSKKDLDSLLKRFSIELENPLCWLSQDRARQFLQQMKPEKLYEIFMITSQLQATAASHTLTDENYEQLKTILEENLERQKERLKAYNEMKERADAAETVVKLKKTISNTNWLLCWAPLVDIEKSLGETQHRIDQQNAKKEEIEMRIAGRKDEEEKLRQVMREMHSKSSELEKNYSEASQISRNAESTKANIKADLSAAVSKCQGIKKTIDEINYEIAESEKTLAGVLGTADRDLVGEKAELMRTINEHEQKLQNDQDQKEMVVRRKEAIEAERKDRYKAAQEISNKIYHCENDERRLERERVEAEQIAKNSLNRFGSGTANIIQLLEQKARMFKKKPIGPIGLFVKVRDNKWTNAVEYNLRNVLRGYICDNAEDRKKLEQLISEMKIPMPNISVVRYSEQKVDTRRYEPDPKFLTVCRMLKIDNPTVFNFLIDKANMENTLLIENDNEARKLMNSNHPPENVKVTVTLTCSDVHPKTADRPYRYYAGRGYEAKLLGEQTRSNEFFNQKIADIRRAKVDLEHEYKERLALLEDSKKRSIEIDEEIRQIDTRIYNRQKKIEKIRGELADLNKIATRETLITNIRNTKAEMEERKKNSIKESEKWEAEIKVLQERYSQQEEKIEEAMNKVQIIRNRTKEHNEQKKKVRAELESFDNDTEKLRSQVRSHNLTLEKLLKRKQELEDDKRKANAIVERRHEFQKPDDVDDPPDFTDFLPKQQLERTISKTETELKRAEKLTGGEHVTKEDLANAKEMLDKAVDDVTHIRKASAKANRAFNERKRLYQIVMDELPKRLQRKFCEFMAMRNYVGDLKVDNAQKRIDITVETHRDAHKNVLDRGSEDDEDFDEEVSRVHNNKKRKKVIQDLKGLSGGERSYTTACFVMALWLCVDSPFRCLDEFDVFMDMVNRRIIMELLTELARKNRHIQFFFFTPQSISEIHYEDVEIFELKKSVT